MKNEKLPITERVKYQLNLQYFKALTWYSSGRVCYE